ncbi:MAG: tRNA epoxyqueuosine(34) reductase QueG [Verrucomicrobiae bacterium]|nr:tRNA epoxyqueuosine(34) reductase QueG [Verrucomicrobiae bacterium]
MKDKIRQFAFELGFDLCGFSKAEPTVREEFLKRWIDSGYHAEMGWMKRTLEKRLNPALVLENARTVISVGASYYLDKKEVSASQDALAENKYFGKISRYSQFIDYHYVINGKLELLSEFILKNYPGEKALCYVDTGPVLEREFGQKSGIGFVGKHTNLISKKFGNWLLLGEIITTIDVEPDAAEKNYCGKCRRCIDACPTRAIVAPFMLDSCRCISYLTIEHKGVIPVGVRHKIGCHLFGCDDCLEVCPWNRFAQEGNMIRHEIKRFPIEMDVFSIFKMDNAEFKRVFGGTPIERLGLKRLCRNACVVLGNRGNPSAIKILEDIQSRNDSLINEHARWAIEEIKKRESIDKK